MALKYWAQRGQHQFLNGIGRGGSLVAFSVSQMVGFGWHACRLASFGVLIGLPAFALVIFAAPHRIGGHV
jgi:MFS transporter, BCD family, chlorophyll transporter